MSEYKKPLSEWFTGYLEDQGFTGSSMNKAIDRTLHLEAMAIQLNLEFHRRLSHLLKHMAAGFSWDLDDLRTAQRWALRLEKLVAEQQERNKKAPLTKEEYHPGLAMLPKEDSV